MTGRSRWCGACRRRHFVHDVVPGAPADTRMPLVRLVNLGLSMAFLYAVLAVWVLDLLKGVSF